MKTLNIPHFVFLKGFGKQNKKPRKTWKLEAVTFIEVPEEEELPSAGSCAANMPEQIDTWIPEHSVKT